MVYKILSVFYSPLLLSGPLDYYYRCSAGARCGTLLAGAPKVFRVYLTPGGRTKFSRFCWLYCYSGRLRLKIENECRFHKLKGSSSKRVGSGNLETYQQGWASSAASGVDFSCFRGLEENLPSNNITLDIR